MIAMILTDIYAMKKQMVLLGGMAGIYVCVGVALGSGSSIMAFFILFSVMFVLSSFSYGEQCQMDLFANTLPISRECIVFGKYMMAVVAIILADVLGCITLGISRLVSGNVTMTDIYLLTFISLVGLIFIAVVIPVIFKLGSERARFVIIAIYIIPFLIGFMLNKYQVIDLNMIINISLGQILLPLFATAVVLLAISVVISVQIYKKKEF